jgi:hypothetical protein
MSELVGLEKLMSGKSLERLVSFGRAGVGNAHVTE